MKSKTSKIKVGTILNKDLYSQVKAQAALEAKTVSDVMEEALKKYTESFRKAPEDPYEWARRLCSNPAFKATAKEIKAIEEWSEYDLDL